jgi:hypothetical protein
VRLLPNPEPHYHPPLNHGPVSRATIYRAHAETRAARPYPEAISFAKSADARSLESEGFNLNRRGSSPRNPRSSRPIATHPGGVPQQTGIRNNLTANKDTIAASRTLSIFRLKGEMKGLILLPQKTLARLASLAAIWQMLPQPRLNPRHVRYRLKLGVHLDRSIAPCGGNWQVQRSVFVCLKNGVDRAHNLTLGARMPWVKALSIPPIAFRVPVGELQIGSAIRCACLGLPSDKHR